MSGPRRCIVQSVVLILLKSLVETAVLLFDELARFHAIQKGHVDVEQEERHWLNLRFTAAHFDVVKELVQLVHYFLPVRGHA